jgi:hypothetical protein
VGVAAKAVRLDPFGIEPSRRALLGRSGGGQLRDCLGVAVSGAANVQFSSSGDM